MFKLESYVTPLLLSYVDRYIKNLQPDDLQLSVWGGDAVLNNLDLKLDVLEEELSLPFSFVSGHIHELRIHVPWIKLGSESVIVTINTIECVLKLKDGGNDKASTISSESLKAKMEEKKKIKKTEMEDVQPPSYVQSLISRVVNNVSVVINNLILKYVEDDIVLSLNVKSVDIFSVDSNWERAFIDLSAPEFLLRKLIDMHDLTVCLDRRNASGKIEMYQDPLLYRCSLLCRIQVEYDSFGAKRPTSTIINLLCEKLDFSVTEQQLPMLLRLAELCLALYYGELEMDVESSNNVNAENDSGDQSDSNVYDDQNSQLDNQQGWTTWAWSFVPEILPLSSSEDSVETMSRKSPPPLIYFGAYVHHATIVFKLSEIIQESPFFSPQKVAFFPFLSMEQVGSSMEVCIKGYDFVNVQFGVARVCIYGQGECLCGRKDCSESLSGGKQGTFLSAGTLSHDPLGNFLQGSLFDSSTGKNQDYWSSKLAHDMDQHFHNQTEQILLSKWNAFALDYVYILNFPEDFDDSSSINMNDLEYSNLHETAVGRFFFGSVSLDISGSMVHRLQKFLFCTKDYEYVPYCKPKPELVDENRQPPDDYELLSLEEFTPIRTYTLTFINPCLRWITADHCHYDVTQKKVITKSRRKTINPEVEADSSIANSPLPALIFQAERIDLQHNSAMYPRRLAKAVSRMNPTSNNLHHLCHDHYYLKVFGFQVGLTCLHAGQAAFPILNLVPSFSSALYIKNLQLPMYWKNIYQPKKEFMFELPRVSVNFTRPQTLLASFIVTSWLEHIPPKPAELLETTLLDDVFKPSAQAFPFGQALLDFTIEGFTWKMTLTDTAQSHMGTVTLILAHLQCIDEGKENTVLILQGPSLNPPGISTGACFHEKSSPDNEESQIDWLTVTTQIPFLPDSNEAGVTFMIVTMHGIVGILDPLLYSWLSYHSRPKASEDYDISVLGPEPNEEEFAKSQVPCSSGRTATLPTDTQTLSALSANISKEVEPLDYVTQLMKIYPLIKNLLIQLDLRSSIIFFPVDRLPIPSDDLPILPSIKTLFISDRFPDSLVLCLPAIKVSNGCLKSPLDIQDIPVFELDITGDTLPWTINADGFSLYTLQKGQVIHHLLSPVAVSSTFAMPAKFNPQAPEILSNLSICIHADMDTVIISFSQGQLLLLYCLYSQFCECLTHIKVTLKASENSITPISQPLASVIDRSLLQSFTSSSQVEALENLNINEVSTEDQPSDDMVTRKLTPPHDAQVKLFIWLQWTLPKLVLNVYGSSADNHAKEFCFQSEVEDINTSIDIEDVFMKVKGKIGSFNVSHLQKSASGSWKPGPFEGIVLSCREQLSHNFQVATPSVGNSQAGSPLNPFVSKPSCLSESNHGFFTITFTRAQCKDLRQKLSKRRDEGNGDRKGEFEFGAITMKEFVNEVCIDLQPCDIVLWCPALKMVLDSFVLPQVSITNDKETTLTHPTLGLCFNSSNLPLTYVNATCLRVFAPSRLDDRILHHQTLSQSCDMCMLQVDTIFLTPQVDNPLSRVIIRKDIYRKAQHLGLHRMPGSLVEDRQYQLDISGIMLSSGVWHKLVDRDDDSPRRLTGRDEILGQNPALDWNTRLDNQNDMDIDFLPLASRFDLRIIIVPAIIYPHPASTNGEAIPIVVCGNSFEVNVTSNMDFYLSTQQVSLLYGIYTKNFGCFFSESTELSPVSDADVQTTDRLHHPEKERVRHRSVPTGVTDSGFESDASAFTVKSRGLSIHSMPVKDTDLVYTAKNVSFVPSIKNPDFVPFEVLLTACSITFMVYSHGIETLSDKERESFQETKQNSRTNRRRHSYRRSSKSYEDMTDEESANRTSLAMIPFVYMCFYQPHSYLSCSPSKQKIEMSCYDISVNGAPANLRIPETEFRLLPSVEDYSLPWWETRPGERDSKTGIRPALYTFTVMDFLLEPADIKIKIERPLKINLGMVAVEQVEVFLKDLQAKVQFPKESEMEASDHQLGKDALTYSLLKGLTKIHHIQMSTDQMVVSLRTQKVVETTSLGLMWMNCLTHVDFRSKDQELVDEMIISFYIHGFQAKTFYRDSTKLFIGPFTTSLNLEIVWGLPKMEPLVPISCLFVETDNMQIHFGQEHYQCLLELHEELERLLEKIEKIFSKADSLADVKKKRSKPSKKRNIPQTVASLDDLRIGIFQYINDSDSLHLQPNPYEIVFSKASGPNAGHMTWCYPEPRSLTLVHVAPVPFRNTDKSASACVEKLTSIPCTLQYWDVLKRSFVNLHYFNLSESEACSLNLGNNNITPVLSHTWRVVLTGNDNNSDQDVQQPCPVSPLSLAACIRVDSLYDPQLVPLFQICVIFDVIQLHLSNHFRSSPRLPYHSLHPFIFDGTLADIQEFAVLTLNNPLLLFRQYCNKTNMEFSSSAHCEVLEYRNLTLLPLLESFDVRGIASLVHGVNQIASTLSTTLDIGPVLVRVSQNTVHTFVGAHSAWKQVMTDNSDTDPVLLNHFIICNETQATFRFGQVDTDESIILHCHEMHPYSWRSHKSKQLLHLCIEGMKWKWCEPFNIDDVGCQVRIMESKQQKATLIIQIKQRTNIQKQVIISGQLVISSYLTQHLEVKVLTNSGIYNEMKNCLRGQMTLPSYIVEHEDIKTIKLRLMGINALWTQEIPITGDKLKENRLIKIPMQDKSNWFHIWCRICMQKFGTVVQRLVLLLPLFVVRSHLPCSLFMTLETPRLKLIQEVEIHGKGQEHQLVCVGGDMTHNVTFHLGSTKKISNPPLALSAGMIEQVSKLPPEPIDIDNLCYHLDDIHQILWPYNDDDLERELTQNLLLSHVLKKNLQNQLNVAPKLPDIELQVSLSQRWSACNSLLVDIRPRYLMINQCGTDIAFIDKTGEVWTIETDQIFTPAVSDDVFRIGIKYKKQLHCSECITISSEDLGPRWYHRPHVQGILHGKGSIKISINMPRSDHSQKVCYLVITSSEKNDIRILTVHAQFNIVNACQKDFYLKTFIIPSTSNKVTMKKCKDGCKPISLKSSGEKLIPLLYWEQLSVDSLFTDATPIPMQHVMFCHNHMLTASDQEDTMWSYPLLLSSSITSQRWIVAVPDSKDSKIQSVPYTISNHSLHDVTYLVISDEKYSRFLLSNNCSYAVYFGQSIMESNTNGSVVYEELGKIHEPPSIHAESCSYYSFPYFSVKYPEMYDSQHTPKLHLGRLKSEAYHEIQWSSGIDVTVEHDVFVNIPNICDIKVHIEKVGSCMHIVIDPVNRAEISAKEIRSRIKGVETTTIVEKNKSLESMILTEPMAKGKKLVNNECVNVGSSLKVKSSSRLTVEIAVQCKHLCFKLLDDLEYPNHNLEVMRMCILDGLIIYRPYHPTDSRLYNINHRKKELMIYLGNIQIDNQMIGRGNFDFPVVFIRQHGQTWSGVSSFICDGASVTTVLEAMQQAEAMVGIKAVLAESLQDGDICLQSLDILSQPISLYLEDTWAVAILRLLDSFLPTKLSSKIPSSKRSPLPISVRTEVDHMITPVIFERLTIQPISLMLSIHASIKLFIASDHTPLSFKKFERTNVFSSSQKLAYDLAMHYVYGTLIRAGWVVGSLDIIGNPAGLVRNISMGIVDFFSLPYHGLTQGPGAFIRGVSRGAVSLMQSISSGTLHSITNMASSVARNMDRLSFDEDYYTRQEESRRTKPNKLTSGLRQGLSGFGISLLGAIAGIVDQPLQTIQKATDPEKGISNTQVATGIVSGMGKGLVGLVTKPMGGAAEFVSQTGQGLLSGTGWTKLPKPKYTPIIEDASDNINGQVKYLGKMLQTLQNPEVICCLAATQVTRMGINAVNYLLLTTEVLFVVSSSEDAQQQAFAISEIECRPKASDSSILYIIPKHANKAVITEEEERNKDRVAEYVENTGFAPVHSKCGDSDTQSDHSPQGESNGACVTSLELSRYQFFVSPQYRNLFITLFILMQNQLLNKGFVL